MEEKRTDLELTEEVRNLLETMQISESELTDEAKNGLIELVKEVTEEDSDKDVPPTTFQDERFLLLHSAKEQQRLEIKEQARKKRENKERAIAITQTVIVGLVGAAAAAYALGSNPTNTEILTALKYILLSTSAALVCRGILEVAKTIIQKSREERRNSNEPSGPGGR